MHQYRFLILTLVLAAGAHASTLSGVVVNTEGAPIPSAHVYIYQAFPKIGTSTLCPSCYRDCGKHEPVDRKGEFRVDDLDSTLLFDILAVAEGYEPAIARRVDLAKGSTTMTLHQRTVADAAFLITGRIVDPDGKPAIGAIVEPSGYSTTRRGRDGQQLHVVIYGRVPGLEQLSITDAHGDFALRIPESGGKLDVRVTPRAFAPQIDRELIPGEHRTIHVAEGATITGRVESAGKPIVGALVAFVQRDRRSSNFLGRQEIGTREDGSFVMTNLAPNETYVVFTPMTNSHGAVAPLIIHTGPNLSSADAGTLRLSTGRRVAGRVVLPEGTTLPPDTRVTLGSALSDDPLTAPIGTDGTFAFQSVPSGDATISLRLPGLRLSPATGVDGRVLVAAEGDVRDLVVVLECDDRR